MFDERTILLVAHVAAAILLLGPVTVATSLFPRYAASATVSVAEALHRISQNYGLATLSVAAFGLILVQRVGWGWPGWIIASLVIFIVAYGLLLGGIVPGQARLLTLLNDGVEPTRADKSGVRAMSGIFAILWLVVLVLMIAKPS